MKSVPALPRSRLLLSGVAMLLLTTVAPAQLLVLDSFNATGGSGAVLAGSSWVGTVTQNAGTITVGGTAKDMNGWGWTGSPLNATGMTTLNLTAQRDAGNTAPSVVIHFEDLDLDTLTISIQASLFAIGVLTQVSIALPAWGDLDPTKIAGWSLGGGTPQPGIETIHMTFDSLSLSGPATVLFHSADSDRNNHIGLLELTRMIELYNTRFGTVRTGCYAVQADSEDGFAPDPTRAGTPTVALSAYHSADPDRDGKIGLLELTRVIELYNTRSGTVRTGEYHTLRTGEAASEDGFNPGP